MKFWARRVIRARGREIVLAVILIPTARLLGRRGEPTSSSDPARVNPGRGGGSLTSARRLERLA